MKTAGTCYLEALRVMARIKSTIFRDVLDFARSRYEVDRKTYHVSAELVKVPPAIDLADAQLPDLLNQFDARQVLHVTYGSVLDQFKHDLNAMLQTYESDYHTGLKSILSVIYRQCQTCNKFTFMVIQTQRTAERGSVLIRGD